MAIYRNDQVEFGFAAEAGPGGTSDRGTGTVATPGFVALLTVAAKPGDRSITVANTDSLVDGDQIRIGNPTYVGEYEVRKVVNVNTTSKVVTLDIPLAFAHGTTDETGGLCNELTSNGVASGNSYATFWPGTYQSIEVPDLVPEVTPHWFLGTSFKRDFAQAYRGRQSFTGSLSNFIVLNGFPFRFPIGKVVTTNSNTYTAVNLSTTTDKGDVSIAVSATTGWSVNDFLQIGSGNSLTTNAEVRQIAAISGTTVTLNYPLMLTHSSGTGTVAKVSGTYVHTISETTDLDTVSWSVLLRDSGETTANDIIRRYVGGLISRATISADEGGVMTMGWDSVPFLDMIHNQRYQTNYGVSADLPKYGQYLSTPTISYPTTEPYFFSQGVIKFFGTEFARIRNFRISINNNEQPRYYIRGQFGSQRGPSEIQVQRREYRLGCVVALPDSISATSSTRTLFKELLLEGNYSTSSSTLQGLAVELDFTRGSNDTISFSIPNDETPTAGLPNTSNEAGQGALILSAKHNIGAESPTQVDLELLFRSLKIVVTDSVAVYP